MKNFKYFVAFVLVAMMMAVSAFATITLNFDVEETKTLNTGDDCYKIVVTQSDDEGVNWKSLKTDINFNYDKIIPVDSYDASVPDYSGEGAVYPIAVASFTTGRTSTELTYARNPVWTIDGEDSSVIIELYWSKTDSYPFTADDTVIYEMYFKFADGVTQDDLVAEDFDVTYVEYANGVLNYKDSIVLNNNVVPEPAVEETYWNVGNGYNLVDADKNVVVNNSPVTKTENGKTEVTVKYGGYYQGADNWAGAALKEAVTIDGLEVEVTYTTLPTSDDCWAYIGVLANPSIFSTNASYNNGYVNLIRYSAGNMSVHGTTKWETVGKYGDGFFALKNGDVLRVCFDKNEEGTYDITYVKNNADVFKLPVAIDLETALGGATTGYVVASASCLGSKANAFEYTVDVAPEELAVAKIPVAAGDTVYEYAADNSYTLTKVTANGTYDIILTNNDYISVIVNSGYTSQKAYSVSKVFADGYFMEVENVANGVLGNDEVSVRVVDPQGIRFFGTVKNVIAELDNFDEYGFIMTVESAYTNLGTDYVLDMALVEAGKAKKGVAKDATTDKYFSRDSEATVIAGVLYGIPKTAEGVQTVIVSRPYYKLGDACVYGEVTKATLYDIAKAIYNVEGYEVAWEYAKEVIELVEGDIDTPVLPELNSEIAIDVSELYK